MASSSKTMPSKGGYDADRELAEAIANVEVESSDEGSDTTSTESEDEEAPRLSGDEKRDDKGDKKDDPDKDDSATTTTAVSSIISLEDFDDTIFKEKMGKIDNIHDMEAFMKDYQTKAKLLVDKFAMTKKKLAEMKKEAKKAMKGKYSSTLTVNVDFAGKNYPFVLEPSSTIKDIRIVIAKELKMKKGDIKNINIYLGDEMMGGRRTLIGMKVSDGVCLRAVLGIKGGAKRKSLLPFEEQTARNVKDDETTKALWGEVFKTCVEMSDDKDINVRALLETIDKETLMKLADELVISKARINDKLFNIASKTKPCMDMKKVVADTEFNYEKMKKSIAKLLYTSGLVGDTKFEVGIVAGALKSIARGG